MSLKDLLNYSRRNFLVLFLLFLSLLMNSGSIFYYFYKFNNLVAVISVVLSLFLTYLFIYFSISRGNQQEKELLEYKTAKSRLIIKILRGALALLSCVLFFFLFRILLVSGSLSAISSPWLFLPNYFWWLLWLLLLSLFANFHLKNKLSYLFITLLYFLFFSISFFIYKIAFGYDQLLHQRAISDILQFGLIEPKKIYYLGQYVLELLFLKVWPFSAEYLDRFLLPFLATILIPLTFVFNFQKRGFNKIIWPLLLFLVLPFSIFTYTVPQNLAFLFLVVLLLFSFNRYFVAQKNNFWFLFSWALAIFFIHPLAGVPAIIFVSILFINNFSSFNFGVKYKIKLKDNFVNVLRVLFYGAQIILLPFLLIISGGRFSGLKLDMSSWIPKILGQENIFLNTIYLIGANKNIFLLILFILATLFVFKKGQKELKIFYYNSVALMLSYFISLFIDFPFLSQIDKSSYAGRILILSFLFLIPIFYELFICLIKKVRAEKKSFQIIILLFLSAILLISFYLNYPRRDNYFNSRSFSVSYPDFSAVRFIESVKDNDNYIVLANQQVGAAAISEFGFKRYYGPWFYYSVQTGGLTYDYYLKMIEKPQKELMRELMKQTGASDIYFVVNDYWWAFDRICEEMKVEADKVYEIENGQILIFYFKF